MIKPHLMYYNHDEDKLPSRKAITRACESLALELVEIVRGWTTTCQVAVIHGKAISLEGEIDYYAELSKVDLKSADRLPVIFISSVPATQPVKPVHFVQPDGRQGVRYLLPIRRTIESGLTTKTIEDEPDEETVDRWISLLGAVTTPGVLEEWFRAPGSPGANSALNDMLVERTSTESLIALSVLCQGYLAVHAFNVKGTAQSQAVGEALRDSGVDAVVCDPALVLPQLATVASPAWWREVFGLVRSEFERGVAREWGIMDFQGCPDAVKGLVGAIFSDGDPISPQTVAEGYLAITKRLRAA